MLSLAWCAKSSFYRKHNPLVLLVSSVRVGGFWIFLFLFWINETLSTKHGGPADLFHLTCAGALSSSSEAAIHPVYPTFYKPSTLPGPGTDEPRLPWACACAQRAVPGPVASLVVPAHFQHQRLLLGITTRCFLCLIPNHGHQR